MRVFMRILSCGSVLYVGLHYSVIGTVPSMQIERPRLSGLSSENDRRACIRWTIRIKSDKLTKWVADCATRLKPFIITGIDQ